MCVREMVVDSYRGGVVYVMGMYVMYSYVHGKWIVGSLVVEVWRLAYVY
jgi:hypothetical protein